MEERDEIILDHIGRHRLTIRPVLDHLFFAEDSSGCGNVLDRLMDQGYIQARQVLPRRRCYYQLTRPGAAGRFPESRSRPMRGQALRTWLAVLWFCCMDEPDRRLLEPGELRRALPEAPTGIHVAEADDTYRVYRIRVVGMKAKLGYVIRRLRLDITAAMQKPTLAAWVRNRDYRFAILAERTRIRQIQDKLTREQLGKHAHIIVSPVPGPHTLQKELLLWQSS